jgi:peptidoglycan/LPS O-acetylase OafA/YrhL
MLSWLNAVSVIPVDDKSETSGGSRPKSARLHYLDWLRVLAILGVIVFHAVHPFDHISWHIKDPTPNVLMTLFIVTLFPWGMPLFFLISGAGSWFALRRRTGLQYAKERVNRLLLPFVIGSILLMPIMGYYELIHKGLYEGPFLNLILDFNAMRLFYTEFNHLVLGPRMFGALGYHLWFLGFLFAFSLIALPLFLWLRGASGRRFIGRLAWLCGRRGGLLLLIIPLTLIQILLRPQFPAEHDWADFVTMLVFFVSGYILYSDERFTHAINRDWPLSLALGLLTTAVIIYSTLTGLVASPFDSSSELDIVSQWTVLSVNGWSWALVMISVGMRYLAFRNRWLEYGQSAIMPMFLLHQPVIIVIAFYVVKWDTGIVVKLPVVLLGSLVVTLAFYELIIKRVGFLRSFFGIK